MGWLWSLAAALLLLMEPGAAQSGGWKDNQINTTMCQWIEPRVGIIRDTLYIDGGYLWWQAGLSDNTFTPIRDSNPLGIVYTLNFSTPFQMSQNFSQVLTALYKGGGGAANNIGPNYFDGAMFANDGEWYTYGGLLTNTSAYGDIAATSVKGYEAYAYGAAGKQFTPGFFDGGLPGGVTRYVSGGAGVSIPSENMGFYFSGLRSASGGPIFFTQANDSLNANVISNTMISVDLSIQRGEKWTNQTLPSSVPGRANAELVWVPVSTRGVLVAIGGVIDPVFATKTQTLNSSQLAESASISPLFMTTVSVYDIANSTWYEQPTSGSPPGALTRGCAVVASAPDYSSHNIYFYGGFAGLNPTADIYSDDMWILSVPSFIWTKAKTGNSSHGRAGHKCVKPYPDQMLVIGGNPQLSGATYPCLADGIVRNFNLSSLEWLAAYDPAKWSNYSVPPIITSVIGGTGSGGATALSPKAWASQSLAALFSTKYDATKIKQWFPYASKTNTTNPSPTITPDTATGGGGVPSWLAPVLGSVLGLIVLSSIGLFIFLYRRRAYFKKQQGSSASSDVATSDLNRYRVLSWVRGGQDPKSPVTVTSSDEATDTTDMKDAQDVGVVDGNVAEAAGVALFEMADTSKVQELSGTGTGMAYLQSYDSQGRMNPMAKSGIHSSPSAASRVSELSNSTQSSLYSASTAAYGRPDSPLIGVARPSGHSRMVSEVSAESSEAGPGTPGLQSDQPHAVQQEAPRTPPERRNVTSPVSPPTPHGNEEDYMSAGTSTHGSTTSGRGTGEALGDDIRREMRRDLSTGPADKERTRRKSAFGEML